MLWMLAQPSATSVPPRGCAVSQKLEDAQAGPRGLIKHSPGTSLPWKTPEGFSSLFFFFSLISSAGNGYIEGKELENFFQELESARKGAGVVRGSPGFAPSFPASLLPQILGTTLGHGWGGGGMGWDGKGKELGVVTARQGKCSRPVSLPAGLAEGQAGRQDEGIHAQIRQKRGRQNRDGRGERGRRRRMGLRDQRCSRARRSWVRAASRGTLSSWSPPPDTPGPHSWPRSCPRRRISCCVSASTWAPARSSWR